MSTKTKSVKKLLLTTNKSGLYVIYEIQMHKLFFFHKGEGVEIEMSAYNSLMCMILSFSETFRSGLIIIILLRFQL